MQESIELEDLNCSKLEINTRKVEKMPSKDFLHKNYFKSVPKYKPSKIPAETSSNVTSSWFSNIASSIHLADKSPKNLNSPVTLPKNKTIPLLRR